MSLRYHFWLIGVALVVVTGLGVMAIRQLDTVLAHQEVGTLRDLADRAASGLAQHLQSAPAEIALLTPGRRQLYVRPSDYEPIVDGFDDDWNARALVEQQFGDPQEPQRMELRITRHEHSLNLFARITDRSIERHRASSDLLASGDHLSLFLAAAGGTITRYVIRSGAPGSVSAFYRDRSGHDRIEPRIRGAWQFWERGFQLELQISDFRGGSALGVAAVLVDDELPLKIVGNVDDLSVESVPPAVEYQPSLSRVLAGYAVTGTHLYLVDRAGWVIADAENERQPSAHSATSLPDRLLQLLSARERYTWSNDLQSGRLNPESLAGSFRGIPVYRWYNRHAHVLARVVTPFINPLDQRSLGAVIIERGEAPAFGEAARAAQNILLATLVVLLLVSVLSTPVPILMARGIRDLANAIAAIIDRRGRLRANVPKTGVAALDHLARQINAILQRMENHHLYLRDISSRLSHELRTPLAIVSSSLDNLELDGIPSSGQSYLQRAQAGLQRASATLTAMSEASRVEDAISGAAREYLSLDKLLGQLVDSYRLLYPQLNIQLELATQDCLVFGNADLLVQMLDKLISNAADFCPAGGRVDLTLGREAGEICLDVANDGPSLPEGSAESVFDALVSIREDARDHEQPHLGLGLYIVRLIAEYHDARVSAHNVARCPGVAGQGVSGVEIRVRFCLRSTY